MIHTHDLWKVTLAQEETLMKKFFDFNAFVRWHTTNEHYTGNEFMKINYEDQTNGMGK